MAYLDMELHNARLLWSAVGDRVLIVGLILLCMGIASAMAVFLGHAPAELHHRP